MWGWLSAVIGLAVTIFLIYLVIQGVLFLGWAIGGGLVVILLVLLIFEFVDLKLVLGIILAILLINFVIELVM